MESSEDFLNLPITDPKVIEFIDKIFRLETIYPSKDICDLADHIRKRFKELNVIPIYEEP